MDSDGKCYCEAWNESECACGNFAREEEEWELDRHWHIRLGENLETVACIVAFGQARYAKGFTDGTLLREFCEDYVPEPYFPMADTRPTAERLGWPRT